jgi:hypothetical protein
VTPVLKDAVRRLSRNNSGLWLWVPAFAGTTKNSRRTSAASRRDASELCLNCPPEIKGVGNAGCPMHPQPPVQQKSTGVEATDTPVHPAFPHAMVLTVSFALSLVTGLVCHHRFADKLRKT